MTDVAFDRAVADPAPIQPASRPNLDKGFNPLTMILFFGILAAGLLYVAYSIYSDVDATGTRVTSYLPYILLFVALLIALGFEFVNGFHDTANAVATVIYTHSLPAEVAVMWSGFFNFLGVLLSSGAVAFGIVSLLPVELILQVGSSAGFAMVFALLIAAILWNLGTWYFGPAGLLLAHADRLDHRSRRCERADARPRRHLGRGLGQGYGDRLCASVVATGRLHLRRRPASAAQADHQEPGALCRP
ncbi:hypothetical protein ACVWZK_007121 [Bradyrhizobium sp. GM0.4]